MPAPALISPVGCSSTLRSMIFKSFDEPDFTVGLTFLNILRDFKFATDLSKRSSVKGSPSSKTNSLLITFSLVTVLPKYLSFPQVFLYLL